MLQFEACFLTKVPRPLGSDKGGKKTLGIGLSMRQKSALSRKGERAEEEGHHCRRIGGNELCMTVVYCALAGSAG